MSSYPICASAASLISASASRARFLGVNQFCALAWLYSLLIHTQETFIPLERPRSHTPTTRYSGVPLFRIPRRASSEVFERFRPGFDLVSARQERSSYGDFDVFDVSDVYPDALPCLQRLQELGYVLPEISPERLMKP
jgi:hypothetical protein